MLDRLFFFFFQNITNLVVGGIKWFSLCLVLMMSAFHARSILKCQFVGRSILKIFLDCKTTAMLVSCCGASLPHPPALDLVRKYM